MRKIVFIGLVPLLVACGGGSGSPPPAPIAPAPPPLPPVATSVGPATCIDGKAGVYDCAAIDLRKRVPLADLGGGGGNDIWGWTDPATGEEYALMGRTTGTTFVRVTDPDNPVIVGRLPTQTVGTPWRDVKTYRDHAFIVADRAGSHGMQIFDLTRLRGVTDNRVFTTDALYSGMGSAHNIVINAESGFAYVVGSDTCDEGLHIVDIRDPLTPVFQACHIAQPETHDAQCVTYTGPDLDYAGRQICIGANSDSIGVTDVTDSLSPASVSNFTYPDTFFVHQLWLDESQRYLLVNDELDETNLNLNTQTVVVDMLDLDNPVFLYRHSGTTRAISHNLYLDGTRVFQANYAAGLQILDFTGLASDSLTETARFDTFTADDRTDFIGAWSVYPFFDSGNIIVSDTQSGLFILTPQ